MNSLLLEYFPFAQCYGSLPVHGLPRPLHWANTLICCIESFEYKKRATCRSPFFLGVSLVRVPCRRWLLTITRMNWLNAGHLSPSPASRLLQFGCQFISTWARSHVGAGLLAMVVNDNAYEPDKRGALESIASKPAPTGPKQLNTVQSNAAGSGHITPTHRWSNAPGPFRMPVDWNARRNGFAPRPPGLTEKSPPR